MRHTASLERVSSSNLGLRTVGYRHRNTDRDVALCGKCDATERPRQPIEVGHLPACSLKTAGAQRLSVCSSPFVLPEALSVEALA